MKHEKYPAVYREAFLKALREPVRLQFSTPQKAIAFRVELYKYRYALRDALPATRELWEDCMSVSLSVQDTTLTLQSKKSKFVEKLNDHI